MPRSTVDFLGREVVCVFAERTVEGGATAKSIDPTGEPVGVKSTDDQRLLADLDFMGFE